MPKKDASGDYVISESGNWNVAARFSEVKIMIPLAKCEVYEDIAKFGYDSYIQELLNYGLPTDVIRLSALNRLINELIKISKNCKFAMKRDNTKDTIDKLEKKLYKIKTIFPLLSKVTHNHLKKTRTTTIADEKIFNDVLECVIEIKSQINDPLNKNHLIFTDKEEFDPQAFKKNILDRMINQG